MSKIRPSRAGDADVVVGQTGQPVAAQPVGARVADVQHVRRAAAQHQRGERASHAGERRVAAAFAVEPAVERAEHPRRGAAHLHRLRQVAEAVKKAAHRHFRRDAAAFGAADSVGDRRHEVAARPRQLPAEDRAGEILVALARSLVRGEPDGRPDAGGGPLSHRRGSSRRAAEPPPWRARLQRSSLQRSWRKLPPVADASVTVRSPDLRSSW